MFSREQEAAADAWAWRLTQLAGYDPQAWLEGFQRIADGFPLAFENWPTHYPPDLRLKDLEPYRRGEWLPPVPSARSN
jgi:predicted Zn-dependent protease